MSEHFLKKINHVSILSKEETYQFLHQWNKQQYDCDVSVISGCIYDQVEKVAKLLPNSLAIQHNEVSVTYAELAERANRLAAYLIAAGMTPNDRICVLIDRTPALIVAMLAIFKMGATYVPINPKFPEDRIQYVIQDSGAKLILADSMEKSPEAFHSITRLVKEVEAAAENNSTLVELPTLNQDHAAYIIYTSGTTGAPKGVIIKHKGVMNLISWYQSYFKVTFQDRSSQFASQGFDTYICETVPFLCTGASVHIIDDDIKLTPLLFLDWIKKNKITMVDLPTSYAQILFSMQWPTEIALRTVKIGGEHVTQYPKQNFPFDIWNGYGPTEATVEATYYKIHSANKLMDHHAYPHPPIGKPIANVEVFVVDSHMMLAPIGVAGELLIGGPGVSAGYLNRDNITKEKFIPHPFDKSSTDVFYRTGDLVRWLEDGNLEYISRIDNQVKIHGYRIELDEIETLIGQYPDIKEVVVVAKDSQRSEKKLVAYIVPNLDKERFLYQARCLISTNNTSFMEVMCEDISKNGICISGISDHIAISEDVSVRLRLPGMDDDVTLQGVVNWKQNYRCGIAFALTNDEKSILEKSIDYHINTHNLLELILSNTARRNIKFALKKKVPEYMIPTMVVKLTEFPLTFSGKIDTKSLPDPKDFNDLINREKIPPKTPTEIALTEIWKEILHKDDISMSDNFFDIGGNSITAAELSVKLYQRYHHSVPAKVIFDLSFIPILAEYIDSNGKSYNDQTSIQNEIQKDCALSESIIPRKMVEEFPPVKHILLTGAGGFLGLYLLRELLQKTDAKIYCFIRKGDFETAAKRLLNAVEKFGLQEDITLNERRIIVIASDISYDHFGLPTEQYNYLANTIDMIYHCGAQVNIMSSYNKLRGSNVLGTLEIIKFACSGKTKPIHYISTLSSAYRHDEAGALTEEFPTDKYENLFGGYAVSKWVSERLLTAAKNRGLPTILYRSGYIFGQSDTGQTSLNDALLMLIKGCIQLGFAPMLDENITLLPVDFVSRAIVAISLKKPTRSDVYHIDHPIGILWSELVSWLNHYGYKITLIPLKEWQAKLATLSHDNAIFPFLPYYLAMDEGYRSPAVRIDKAKQLLMDEHLPYPPIDDHLLTTYFNYLCDVKFLEAPAHKTIEKA